MIITKRINLRALCISAVMGALGFILMLLEFPLPIIPSFIKMDFSEFPALITSFAFGGEYGVLVCLVKNLLHLFITTSAGVGELSNFLLGAVFTFTCGLIYGYNKTRKGALTASLIGAGMMALLSVPLNYFIVFPAYTVLFGMPREAIVNAYMLIIPQSDTLLKSLFIFNLPFTFIKGIFDSLLCFLSYKRISPILKYGIKRNNKYF